MYECSGPLHQYEQKNRLSGCEATQISPKILRAKAGIIITFSTVPTKKPYCLLYVEQYQKFKKVYHHSVGYGLRDSALSTYILLTDKSCSFQHGSYVVLEVNKQNESVSIFKNMKSFLQYLRTSHFLLSNPMFFFTTLSSIDRKTLY